ncbi:hypothetical protein [Breoghania sp. L-A4]|uniref:hypothetical protein n=1 Tax=Breoghania sp. L-A4 TaxID=2304600 RepID=UPI000E35D542|nr:hypothetical protein [Breoghania sp. L-A4]AXS39812.1 hypothetical protein D1F64_06785 [Breoghania sp. L-A4]
MTVLRILALVLAVGSFAGLASATEEHLGAPSAGAQGMPGAQGTFEFKPTDWTGMGTSSWWTDTDGVDPGSAGCHIGRTEDGTLSGRTFGEACTEAGLLVESNPGAEELHKHTDDIGHPDLFDCNAWCTGQGKASGMCVAAEAPPCASSAICSCQ